MSKITSPFFFLSLYQNLKEDLRMECHCKQKKKKVKKFPTHFLFTKYLIPDVINLFILHMLLMNTVTYYNYMSRYLNLLLYSGNDAVSCGQHNNTTA